MNTDMQSLATSRRGLAIQLVDDPQNPAQLVIRRLRRWDRVVARALSSSLDQQIAAGRRPESSRLLATRAQQLVSPATRRNLAQSWAHVLELTSRAPVPRGPRAPLLRELVTNAEPDVRQLMAKLSTPMPTSARGVAMARAILTDATGPLFNRRCSADLRTAIRDATAHLDSAALTPA